MTGIYLLLGSNLGHKQENLSNACLKINRLIGNIEQASSIYYCEPWGMSQAPAFLNQALSISTRYNPTELLDKLLEIEIEMGRQRSQGYQNRTIDIDILYYQHIICDKPRLKIPHPRIQERRFALEPLAELASDFVHPVLNLTNKELLDQCEDPLSVSKVGSRE